jgi:hypothetical protein
MNERDIEIRKELIKKRDNILLKINQLRRIKLSEINIIQLFDKMALLKSHYTEVRILNDKIREIEKLA